MGICLELSPSCSNCPKWTLRSSVPVSSLLYQQTAVTPTFGSSDLKVRHTSLPGAVVERKGGSSSFVFKAPESQLYRSLLLLLSPSDRGVQLRVCFRSSCPQGASTASHFKAAVCLCKNLVTVTSILPKICKFSREGKNHLVSFDLQNLNTIQSQEGLGVPWRNLL